MVEKAAVTKLNEVLKAIEWHRGMFNNRCPFCEETNGEGHKADCDLAAVITYWDQVQGEIDAE